MNYAGNYHDGGSRLFFVCGGSAPILFRVFTGKVLGYIFTLCTLVFCFLPYIYGVVLPQTGN